MAEDKNLSDKVKIVKVERAFMDDIEHRIEDWLEKNVVEYEGAKVRDITVPTKGGSGETLIVHFEKRDDKPAAWHTVVIRKDVLELVTNPLVNFDNQLKVQTVLGKVPELLVPSVLGSESSAEVLGAPFFVMPFVDGRNAAEAPPYPSEGWVFDATEQQRQYMWQSGMDAMVRIHNFDWQQHELQSLEISAPGTHDNERYLNFAVEHFRAQSKGLHSDVCEKAIDWLQKNVHKAEKRVLCWGDPRIGNIIWNQFDVASVIDWDVSFIGTPGHDVGWWSFFHRWQSHGFGLADLSGMVVGQPLADLYCQRGGIDIENFTFYEILATLRGMSIWLSTYHSMKAQGTLTEDINPLDDSIHMTRVLIQLMNEAS